MPTDPNLLLQIWLSPNFPTGAFAYSHGLEWAVEAGDVRDGKQLIDWILALLQFGAARNDAIFVKLAWETAEAKHFEDIKSLNELALALSPSRERYLEQSAQGNAFLAAIALSWPCATLAHLNHDPEADIAYPIALGIVAAGHCIGLLPLLRGYTLGFCNLLVSAAMRLGTIGQIEAQKTLAACCEKIEDLAEFASSAELDDLGSCAFRADLASLHHETQYSRLFRS